MSEKVDVPHPGTFIKTHVLPVGMSVTQAAKLVGVGRPALSNLLNGNAALSPEMALRLEKTFGVKREALLQMQVAHAEQDASSGKRGRSPGLRAEFHGHHRDPDQRLV